MLSVSNLWIGSVSLSWHVPSSSDADTSEETNPRIYRVWTPKLGKPTVLRRCLDYATCYLLCTIRALRLPAQDVIVSLTTPPYIAWAGVSLAIGGMMPKAC